MHDFQAAAAMSEADAVDIMAASMVQRFGERAAALATAQTAAEHAAGNGVAERWLSIFLSIEDRLGRGRLGALPDSRVTSIGGV